MKTLIQFLVNGLAVFVSGYLLPEVYIENYWIALLTAFVLGLLNLLVKPFLLFFSLPITIVTFGLFTLVIDTIVILLAAELVPGFAVNSFLSAFLFAVVLSVFAYLFHTLLGV
ncbi:phage holin family protein [candidate division WWE3 bacterium]|nr:phage holin family protein [candidate division WWE3 bacterium]